MTDIIIFPLPAPPIGTVRINLPPINTPPGVQAPLLVLNLTTPFVAAHISLAKGAEWPAGDAITIESDISIDNGINFSPAASITYAGDVWKNKALVVVTQSDFRFAFNSANNSHQLINALRFRAIVLQTINVGFIVTTEVAPIILPPP